MVRILLFLVPFFGICEGDSTEANPIRRIVTLLQDMQKEVEAEGEKEGELYEKFACFCKGNSENMSTEAEAAKTKIEQLTASVDNFTGEKARLDEELKEHFNDREEAKKAAAESTRIREKEHEEFVKEAGDEKANVDALNKAIPALEKGMGTTGLMQINPSNNVSTITVLKKLALISENIDEYEKRSLLSFLSQASSSSAPGGAYVPVSGEIVGILKQLKENIDKRLGGIVSEEQESQKNYEQLIAAKNDEIRAATGAIETKTKRSGELAVSIVEAKTDLKDTNESLSENEALMANLSIECDKKAKEWEERQQVRSDEISAISEAISVLNDDDALDMFKKTLPTPGKPAGFGFLQAKTGRASRQQQALDILRSANIGKKFIMSNIFRGTKLDLLSFMLQGKNVDFTKVIRMIDTMVAHLGEEQNDDDSHKSFCEKNFDENDDRQKAVQNRAEGLRVDIEESVGFINQLDGEVKVLQTEVADLDKLVAEATTQRKKENAEFVQSQAELNAASQLIGKAVNKLNKFYNPNLYNAPKKRELTEEERIFQASGGEVDDSAPVEYIHGTSQTTNFFLQLMQSPPSLPSRPETWDGKYKKKGSKSTGVVALLGKLKKDLDMDIQEGRHDEENAQNAYQKLMAESGQTRDKDIESITNKQSSKADLEARVQQTKAESTAAQNELQSIQDNIKMLHNSCDFLLENYEHRREARRTEAGALGNAKAALQGAKV